MQIIILLIFFYKNLFIITGYRNSINSGITCTGTVENLTDKVEEVRDEFREQSDQPLKLKNW